VLSTKGLHTINTSVTPHVENATQYVNRTSNDKFGVLSSDKNTLFFTAGSALYKFNVSVGLATPTQLSMIYMDDRNSKNNIRLSLTEDSTLLTSWGNVYDTSFVIKAKNGQKYLPVIGLPGRSFYAIPSSTSDAIHFLDEETSHKLTFLETGKTGLPGALAVTSDGNTLFASSTGGMMKFTIGMTPPGEIVSPPASMHQYRDFAFDMPRNLLYGTDASGRVDVIDQDTGAVVDSFLLPNGADPIGIDLSPDGSELAVALNELQSILFLNAETGAVIARVKPLNNDDSNLPYDVIYGRAGRLYSNAQPDFEYIHVFDTTTHTWLAKSDHIISTGAEMAITSDHKYLYANQKLSPNNIYVLDVQTDTVMELHEGPHGYVTAPRFTIIPDGSKVFTSTGQVWSGDMQTRLGSLYTEPGVFIKFIPNKNMVALTHGSSIEFLDATNYHSIWLHYPGYGGNIVEMEVAPDGSQLVANYPDGTIYLLSLREFPPTPLPSATPGPGPSPTPRPSSTPGPSPTPMPPSFTGNRRTYTAAGGSILPGSFLCDQTQLTCSNGADTDADNAHQYAADTFVFYNTYHGRNSIDNHGSTITSSVHYGINYYNAFWNGFQVVYGDWMAADDVVGHELTHGVTQHTSSLIYAYQSGAINESFSDLWGEFIDQTNGSGNDTESVKWLIAEDSFNRAMRSMKNPPAYGNPDKMSSLLYYNGSADNGGVHINSGVNNKAVYLMVEGNAFNGRTITGIGLNKTAAVYYEAQVYHLTMGANYNDLYYALLQACQNLIGGTDGITQSDCDQVQAAAEAVEMIPTTTPVTEVPTYPPYTPSTSTSTNTPYATLTVAPSKTNTPLTLTPTATGTATATLSPSKIDVLVGGLQVGNYSVGSGQATRVNFSGTNNGPVKITNRNSPSILAAERVIYRVNGANTSFSEMMGLPDSQLDNTYWLPWYNTTGLDTQLRFANVSHGVATVRVFIGGTEMTGSPFTLVAGASTRKSFAGINTGPVQIISDQDIVVAERVIYKATGGIPTSFSEMMALPDHQLDTTYWLPWYNNVDLDTQLRFANVSDQTASVHVFIAGQEMQGSPFTLAPGASARKRFAGVNNGPVKVLSNQAIVVAERVIYKVNGIPASFSEMMALPNHQLDLVYWLPWYNNRDLDTQLRFANTTDSTATVHIYIGGVEMQGSPFTLQPGGSTRTSFTGLNNGPVQIVSNRNIVAAGRVIYKVQGIPTSFSEMMALPDNLLGSTFWFPWYNNVDLDTQLRFGVP
jgi:DNA-binding beta-propeller fold protein YncE